MGIELPLVGTASGYSGRRRWGASGVLRTSSGGESAEASTNEDQAGASTRATLETALHAGDHSFRHILTSTSDMSCRIRAVSWAIISISKLAC
jgi:hypothetical protein